MESVESSKLRDRISGVDQDRERSGCGDGRPSVRSLTRNRYRATTASIFVVSFGITGRTTSTSTRLAISPITGSEDSGPVARRIVLPQQVRGKQITSTTATTASAAQPRKLVAPCRGASLTYAPFGFDDLDAGQVWR